MTNEHYTTLFNKIETVLKNAGFTRAKSFKLRDDGMVYQDEGFNIVPAELSPTQRQAERVEDFEVKLNITIAYKFSPYDWYVNNIAALADTESLIYEFELLASDDDLHAAGLNVSNVKSSAADYEQIEEGLLYIKLPVTVSYRHE